MNIMKCILAVSAVLFIACAKNLAASLAGMDLQSKYLKVPFGSYAGDVIYDHFNLGEGTLEFWIKLDSDGGKSANNAGRYFFFWGKAHNVNCFAVEESRATLYFRVVNADYHGQFLYCSSAKGWPRGQWHHVAATWRATSNGMALGFFVDGVSMGKTNFTGALPGKVPYDLLFGRGKKGTQVDVSLAAPAEMALARVSRNVRYMEAFTPETEYGVDENTLCFLPLQNDTDARGFFRLPDGKEGRIEAEIIDVNDVRTIKAPQNIREAKPMERKKLQQNTWLSKYGCLALAAISNFVYGASDFSFDCVPRPKEAKIMRGEFVLQHESANHAFLVVAPDSPKTLIGAGEINKKIMALGGKALPVKNFNELTPEDKTSNLIIIGGPLENPLAADFCREGGVVVDDRNPGKQGYVIRFQGAGKDWRILLCGSDAQGSLYACVTFCYLLDRKNGKITAHKADIRDWPDFKLRWDDSPVVHRREGETASLLKALYGGNHAGKQALDYYKENIDWMLRHKLNVIDHEWKGINADTTAAVRYAKERGIETVWVIGPTEAVGTAVEDKGKPEFANVRVSRRSPAYYVCWSRDDLRRKYMEKQAALAAQHGFSIVIFHCTDTGMSTFNYAEWNDRCEECRKRFGNDRAAADANVINMIRDIFHKTCPDAKLYFVVYPYDAEAVSDAFPGNCVPGVSGAYAQKVREELRAYYRRLVKLVPEDVGFCVRESARKDAEQWRSYFGGHPSWIYFATGDALSPMFHTNARCAKTFFFNDDTTLLYFSDPPLAGQVLDNPVRQLLGTEFAWNTAAPGADYFKKGGYRQSYFTDGIGPEIIMKEFVPLACRNIWGKDAAPFLTGLFTNNINPMLVEKPDKFKERLAQLQTQRSEDIEAAGVAAAGGSMNMTPENYVNAAVLDAQYRAVTAAADSLKKLLDSGTPLELYGLRYAVTYYEYCRLWSWYADLWRAYFRMEETKDMEDILALEKKGKALCEELPGRIKAVLKENEGRPQFYGFFPAVRGVYGMKNWLIKPEEFSDWFTALRVRREFEAISGSVRPAPPECLAPRIFQAIRTGQAPIIDGKLDDACWQAVPKYGNFVRFPGIPGPVLALAQSEVRFAYDETNLYVAVVMQTIGGRVIAHATRPDMIWNGKDDVVQVFLADTSDRKKCGNVYVNPAGIKNCECGGIFTKAWKVAVNVMPEAWLAEFAFPLPDGKLPDKLAVSVCRQRSDLPAELSSTQLCKERFCEPENFSVLVFQKIGVKCGKID